MRVSYPYGSGIRAIFICAAICLCFPPAVIADSPAQAPTIAEADRIPLRLWDVPDKRSTSPLSVADRRVFEGFCRKYPEVRIVQLEPLHISGPAAEGSQFLAVAGGVAPDVFYLFGRQVGDYYDQGFLLPLDEYVNEYTKRTGKPYTGVNAPSMVWELAQIDGRVWCVPKGYYSMALLCRKDIFASAGVELKSPQDWDEFYRMARRLTRLPSKEPDAKRGDSQVYGLNMLTGIYAGWHFLQYIWSSGGEVVQGYYPLENGKLVPVPAPPFDYRRLNIAIGNSEKYYKGLDVLRERLTAEGVDPDYSMTDLKWRLVSDDDASVEALKWYRRILYTKWLRCENKHEDREFDLSAEMLENGRAACPVCGKAVDISTSDGRRRIYVGVTKGQETFAGKGAVRQSSRNQIIEYAMNIGTMSDADASNVDTQSMLAFPSRTKDIPPAAFIAGHYLAINATQQDKRIREAAWKYIEYVTGPEAQRIRVQTFVEAGLEEFIRPSVLKSLGFEQELENIPYERRKLWDLLERYAKVEPYCKGFQHVMTREYGVPIDAIIGDVPDEKGRFARDPKKLMADTCTRVNKFILGDLPEEVIKRRTRVGWFVAVAVVLLLVGGAYATVRLAVKLHRKAADFEGYGVQGKTVRRTLTIVFFLAPAIGLVVLWGYYPILRGTVMAFQDYKILGGSTWVNLKNFIEVTSSPEFWRYLLQTLQYLVMSLVMGFFAPIALAIFLTEIPKGKVFFRVLYYLPAVTTGIVTMFMWKQLLYEQSDTGLINSIILYFNDLPAPMMIVLKGLIFLALAFAVFGLARTSFGRGVTGWGKYLPLAFAAAGLFYLLWRVVGITGDGGASALVVWFAKPWNFTAQKFLQDRDLAMFWIIVPTIWAGVGPGCLIYLAALKGIPEEQYEAADLDGASIWAKCVHVVYPNLSALIVINFVGAVVGAMRASTNIFVMTGGGPEDVTVTVGLDIWFKAYLFLNFGMATAEAWILGALLIGFTLYQLRLLNKMQFSAAASKEAAK
ncbi:MAG: extracellular solute-binding protein [Planctomycetes bacterium]|nr:extracellular solute-binding protein [Planctomycetota bacterium]